MPVIDLGLARFSKTDSISAISGNPSYLYVNGGVATENFILNSYQGQFGINIGMLSIEVGASFGNGIGISAGCSWGDSGIALSGQIDTQLMVSLGVSKDYTTTINNNLQSISSTGYSVDVHAGLIAMGVMAAYGVPAPMPVPAR